MQRIVENLVQSRPMMSSINEHAWQGVICCRQSMIEKLSFVQGGKLGNVSDLGACCIFTGIYNEDCVKKLVSEGFMKEVS